MAVKKVSDYTRPLEEEPATNEAEALEARLEAILDSIGGFGRHQVWIFFVIFFSCNGFNLILYNLNYLEKIP